MRHLILVTTAMAMFLSFVTLGVSGTAGAGVLKNTSVWTAEVTGNPPPSGFFSCEAVTFYTQRYEGHRIFKGDVGGDSGFWTPGHANMTWEMGSDYGLQFGGKYSAKLKEYRGDFQYPYGGPGIYGVLVQGDVNNC